MKDSMSHSPKSPLPLLTSREVFVGTQLTHDVEGTSSTYDVTKLNLSS